jgi:hypothetical protein
MTQHPPEVVITTQNTISLTLGITATVIGVFALLFGWVPFLGLLAIPVAVIGGALAALGLVIALFKGFRGAGLPLLGGTICIAAVILPLVSTGSTSVAITATMDEVAREMENQRNALKEESERKQEQENSVKAAYIAEHLELYDVAAKYRDSLLDGRVPGVLFKLSNDGDRSLDKVEVTVYFKDASGRVLAEEDYLPVLVTDFSYSGDAKPLKAGYVWQMEEGKFYAAKSVPSEWDEGSIEAKITDIQFTESE